MDMVKCFGKTEVIIRAYGTEESNTARVKCVYLVTLHVMDCLTAIYTWETWTSQMILKGKLGCGIKDAGVIYFLQLDAPKQAKSLLRELKTNLIDILELMKLVPNVIDLLTLTCLQDSVEAV